MSRAEQEVEREAVLDLGVARVQEIQNDAQVANPQKQKFLVFVIWDAGLNDAKILAHTSWGCERNINQECMSSTSQCAVP